MNGPELLRLLMEADGLNPNSLADRLGNKKFQSQIQRFLSGQTQNPRTATLKPIADHFKIGFEAFLNDQIAKRVAQDRGLIAPSSVIVTEPQSSFKNTFPFVAPAQPSLRDSLRCISKILGDHDEQARRAVSTLLSDLALHPESSELTTDRILALLGVMGKEPLHRSTASG